MLNWKSLFTLLPYYSCFCYYWEEKWTLKRVTCLFDHSLSFTIIVSLQISYFPFAWQSKRKYNLPYTYFWLWSGFRFSSVYSSIIWLPNQPSSCSNKYSNPKFTYLSSFILQLLSMNATWRQDPSEMNFNAVCTFSNWYIEAINRNLNFFVLCHVTSYFLSPHFSSKDIMEWFS